MYRSNRFSSRITKKKSVQILDRLDPPLEVVVAQALVVAEVVVGLVVEEKANQMLSMRVVDGKDSTSLKLIEIQVLKGHTQKDFISFQKRR